MCLVHRQTQQLLLVQEEKLRRTEERVVSLEAQLARQQEQLAVVTQERDDAVQAAARSQVEARTLRDALANAPALPVLDMSQNGYKTTAQAEQPRPSSPSSSEGAAQLQDAATASGPNRPPGGTAAVVAAKAADLSPQAVVQRIRRDRGYDLEVQSEQVGACLTTLYASLDSALQKLAVDIYSSDSRFVLELIQNADDNSYVASVQPTFRLQVTPDQVKAGRTCVLGSGARLTWRQACIPWDRVPVPQRAILTDNNEVGFSPRNVESLCSIGGSTKSDAAHYIGRKGIGFKSVFKVRPTVVRRSWIWADQALIGASIATALRFKDTR